MKQSQPDMRLTEFGFALASEKQPRRAESMFWLKLPEGHVYQWDGDGWYRIKPPEPTFLPDGDLPHG